MPDVTGLDSRPTFAIETHGCKLNQADSSVMARDFVSAGYEMVEQDQPADVYVLNSCTVTHVADRKARHALRAARRRNPQGTVVAAGCYPERVPDELRGLDAVDLVVGNKEKESLVRQVTEWRGEPPVPCATGSDSVPLSPRMLRTRASVKIQEGCDQVCAYCIVPKVRGRERSIQPEVIIDNISRFVGDGYREVVLTGTQLGSYGFELPGMDLPALLGRILCETGVERLRVSSLQPPDITPELLELWSDSRLCPHFHLPLQSGSDSILERMRRRYTAAEYMAAVLSIRRSVPNASVTADVIAGFPGEGEGDFDQSFLLCETIGFAALHVFPYSVRPGTSAAHFEDKVPSEVKSERVQRLMELAKLQGRAFRSSLIGSVRPVLWEEGREADGGTEWRGLTDNYIRVQALALDDLTNTITPARLIAQQEDLVHTQVLPIPS